MGQPEESVERRSGSSRQADHHYIVDSQFRAFRSDRKGLVLDGTNGSRLQKMLESDPQAGLIFTVLDDLARRIDNLEKNGRILSDDIRRLHRREQQRRSLLISVGIIVGSILACRWIIEWL